jgi:hypothetical protein
VSSNQGDVLQKTEEELARKVTLTRINSCGDEKRDTLFGWELTRPKKGAPYVVYLGTGKALKTTDVMNVTEGDDAFTIKTLNSVYRIQYP